jgi:hypothetical protein
MMRENGMGWGSGSLLLMMLAWALCCGMLARTQDKSGTPPGQRGASITDAMRVRKSYDEILKQRRLTEKDAEMRKVFTRTATGAALARIATLVPYGLRQDNVAEASQMAEDLALVNASPEPSLTDLRKGFSKLSEKYWNERQFLIQVGGRLAVSQSEVANFLTEEMTRSAKLSAENPHNLEYLSPVTAADTLLRVVTDPVLRDAAFRKAAKGQTDEMARRLVVSRYELVDAARARALARDLDLLGK